MNEPRPRGLRPKTTNYLIATLRERRKQLEVRQWQLGTALGVSESTVALWEHGENSPSIDRLLEWAGLLGVEIYMRVRDDVPPITRTFVELPRP